MKFLSKSIDLDLYLSLCARQRVFVDNSKKSNMDEHLYIEHSLRWRLVWATCVCCFSTLQFGFHLSVFNAPQNIISCQDHVQGHKTPYGETLWGRWDRKQCISMDKSGISTINTVFTVAGLISSLLVGSHSVLNFSGRRTLLQSAATLYMIGSVTIAFANSFLAIDVGRFLVGIAAGSSMVVAPIFINEVSPFNKRGLMGSILQFGVPIGILLAQIIAFIWSNDFEWRYLFVFGGAIGLIQLILLFTSIESPKWLIMHCGKITQATRILNSLRSDEAAAQYEILHWRRLSTNMPDNNSQAVLSETSSLLESSPKTDFVPLSTEMSRRGSVDPSTLSPKEYLTESKYRKEWVAIAIIMCAQQLSGMNAITFYGVSVLANIVPPGTNVLVLTSSLAATNVVAAAVASPLTDKWGRKFLLLLSIAIMGFCSVIIPTALLLKKDYIAAVGCFGFTIGFAFGLGQIPFLMVSELSSHEAIGKAQSLGTTCNWLSNVAIAYSFPFLKDSLGDSVFYIFVMTAAFFFVVIFYYVPETKGKVAYEDIWTDD